MDVTVDETGAVRFRNFTPAEGYGLAVRLEREGLAFFERAASVFHDESVGGVFAALAEAERGHLALFERWLALEGEDSGGAEAGLSGLVAPPVFAALGDLDALFEGVVGAAGALAAGVSVEEGSIAFYEALLAETESPSGRGALERILAEERGHLETLRKAGGSGLGGAPAIG